MKIAQERLSLITAVDTDSNCYDSSKGKQIAINCGGGDCDGPSSSKPSYFPDDKMDRQEFISTETASLCDSVYAVGWLHDKRIRICPLERLLQMKPSFRHLDMLPESSKKEGAAATTEGGMSDAEEPEVTETIRVKFAREETEYEKKRRETSFAHHEKQVADEVWTELHFNSVMSETSQQLLLKSTESSAQSQLCTVKFQTQPTDLLRMIIPAADEHEFSLPNLPSDVISLSQLRTLPLPEQIRALMLNVKVIRFRQLVSLLPPDVDQTIVLRTLQQFAVLVQGCWVVKSEILYPQNTHSARTGISADVLCRARNLALYKFTGKSIILRKEITEVLKIPQEDLHDILNPISKFMLNKGWEFYYPLDEIFTTEHPEVVEKQKLQWQAVYTQLTYKTAASRQRKLSGSSVGTLRDGHRTNSKSQSDTEFSVDVTTLSPQPKRQRRNSRRNSSSAGPLSPPMSPRANAQSPFDFSAKKTIIMPASNGFPSTSTAINIQATPMADVKPSNGSMEANLELKTALKELIQQKFTVKPVLSLGDIKRLLLLKLTDTPPGHILSSAVSDRMIQQTAIDAGATIFHGGRLSEMTFVSTSSTENEDVRKALVDLLQSKDRFRFKLFKEKCVEKLGDATPSDSDLRKLLKDYCDQKSGIYSLIGT